MSFYDFNIFEKAGIDPSPDAVVYGIENDMLPPSAASDLEEWMIENQDADGMPAILVADSKEEALGALREAGYTDDGSGGDILRYAVLASMAIDELELPYEIEEVYSSFGYPKDLEPCIYYMPISDGDPSPAGLRKRFADFLVAEKTRLGL